MDNDRERRRTEWAITAATGVLWVVHYGAMVAVAVFFFSVGISLGVPMWANYLMCAAIGGMWPPASYTTGR